MTGRSWMAGTALLLALVTAATVPAPRDAIAGILVVARISGPARAGEAGPVTIRAADAARSLQEAVSARVPTWMIVLLVIIALLVLLIHHAWTGGKLLIRGR